MVRISRLIFHNLCLLIMSFDISEFLHDNFLTLNATNFIGNIASNSKIDCSYLLRYVWKQTLRKCLFSFRKICQKRSEVIFSMPSYWRLGFVLFVFANRNKKYLHAKSFIFLPFLLPKVSMVKQIFYPNELDRDDRIIHLKASAIYPESVIKRQNATKKLKCMSASYTFSN